MHAAAQNISSCGLLSDYPEGVWYIWFEDAQKPSRLQDCSQQHRNYWKDGGLHESLDQTDRTSMIFFMASFCSKQPVALFQKIFCSPLGWVGFVWSWTFQVFVQKCHLTRQKKNLRIEITSIWNMPILKQNKKTGTAKQLWPGSKLYVRQLWLMLYPALCCLVYHRTVASWVFIRPT